MKLIKLNAIASTNAFLKAYSQENSCENFTVVWTLNQTNGKGQFGSIWQSERGKSLAFSVLMNEMNLNIHQQFYLSMYVSSLLVTVLEKYLQQKVAVKWPNDILADKQKIAGILIENTVKGSKITKSIIGIGLNVNQEHFPVDLPKATSLFLCAKTQFNIENLLHEIVASLENGYKLLLEENHLQLKELYFSKMYKFRKPTMFIDNNKNLLMAKIVGVSLKGELLLEHNDERVDAYQLKTIAFQEFVN